jgi:MFS superfamily sulfate permease-like transporter
LSRAARELSGALGDSGVLAPIALALIAVNGFHPTPLFLVFGIAYAAAGLYYRLPVPVQPLKAMAVIALSMGAGVELISLAAFEMAVVLGIIAVTGGARLLERVFTRPLVRGVQLGVGLLLIRKAIVMLVAGDGTDHLAVASGSAAVTIIVALAVLIVLLVAQERVSRIPAALILLGAGAAFSAVASSPAAPLALPEWSVASLDPSLATSALILLVIPQLPLTLGNAAVASAATARDYYGERAARVSVRALCTSMSAFNFIAAFLGGFPVCHGSGGFTSHYRFGARSGWSTFALGAALVVLALMAPRVILSFVAFVPLAVLAAMLAYIGVLHAMLVRDVIGRLVTAGPALLVGVVSLVTANLMVGIAVGGALELAIKLYRSTQSSRS